MKGRKKLAFLAVLLLTLAFLAAGCGKPDAKDSNGSGMSSAGTTADPGWTSGQSDEAIWEEDEDQDEQGDWKDSKDSEDSIDPDTSELEKQYSNLYDYKLDEDGSYTSKDDVLNYLVQYQRLPDNFITKKEARALGWSGGSLEPYAPGKCIGGDRFGNYEEKLPDVKGRTYYECDIDTLGAKKRGAKRIVFSEDGHIYYTEDHYETFELLFGDDTYED